MSNDNQNTPGKGPSHIAYHVREGEGQKAYFNRIGAVWQHKDGQGFNMQLDTVPIDGRVIVRSVQERLQEMKDSARDDERPAERRESARGESREERSSNREDRRPRDAGPRYER